MEYTNAILCNKVYNVKNKNYKKNVLHAPQIKMLKLI